VVGSVPQGAEHGRESVNPTKMILCPGLHNPFASKQTTVDLQQFVFWCQEKVNSPTSGKTSYQERTESVIGPRAENTMDPPPPLFTVKCRM